MRLWINHIKHLRWKLYVLYIISLHIFFYKHAHHSRRGRACNVSIYTTIVLAHNPLLIECSWCSAYAL